MTIQYVLELAGTFFFSISGALASKPREQDWFGATFIGFITAIGGGSLRDMLLGSYPLVWISNISFLYAILAGIVVASLFYPVLIKLRRTFLLFDTLGIAFFTIIGTEKALTLGAAPEIAAMMGMFTAVMGGVIRDTLTNEVPVIFRKEIYATACLMGAASYLLLNAWHMPRNASFLLASLVIILIRLLAVKYQLSLPNFPRAD
jgi:uncharacterized membrane protein YeiH